MGSRRNDASAVMTFWLECLRTPRNIGAVLPSGSSLSTAIASEVLKSPPGQIIELGAGTGAITRALVNLQDAAKDMIVLEKSDALASLLRSQFSHLTIKTACATEISSFPLSQETPLTLVSSIPFKALKQEEAQRIITAITDVSKKVSDFRLIQYSYFLKAPFPAPEGFSWKRGKIVLANIPPARVWTLTPIPQ